LLYGQLSKIFGLNNFHDGQLQTLKALRSKRDCISIIPTGTGKSLIHQLFAATNTGVSIVFVPTLPIMEGQREDLLNHNIKAACLGSAREEDLEDIEKGVYKILYTCPEWLFEVNDGAVSVKQTNLDLLLKLEKKFGISLITVDECHLIKNWGIFLSFPFLFFNILVFKKKKKKKKKKRKFQTCISSASDIKEHLFKYSFSVLICNYDL